MQKTKTYIIFTILIAIFILIASFSTLLEFITDYQWFQELGYTKTFLTRLRTQGKIGLPIFIISFGIILTYIKYIKKKYYEDRNIRPFKSMNKWLNIFSILVSALISLFIASSFASNLWFSILKFKNKVNFNIKDPIFNNDISFYIFTQPLLKDIILLLLLFIGIMIIISLIFYIMMFISEERKKERPGSQRVFDGDFRQFRRINIIDMTLLRKILSPILVLISSVFIILAVNFLLNSYDLLYSSQGIVYGAGFTDIKVGLWMYRILSILSILSAITFLYSGFKKKTKKVFIGPMMIIVVLVLGGAASGLVQRFLVEPNEISKESKYLQHNMDYTQAAYGLHDVKLREFPVDQELTREDLDNNEEIIRNIRINDYRPTRQVYNQLQAIRMYYNFHSVDVDRYDIDGKNTQVFLSARELNQENLQTKTWINKHLKYTHGYGVALSPVNSITSDGQPELLIKNIPPVSNEDLEISRPEIYFGESTNDYIVVNTNEKEFDYPEGSDNKETIYEGSAGIKLKGLNRLLYAIKEKSYNLFISSNIKKDSRIIRHRNINERIRKIAPFISYDEDPYIVLNQEDGRLYWIMDGFTTSNRYPYSKPFDRDSEINYIKNSVKVVVDAYNGDVNYYIFDEEDPIIESYRKIFPDLFLGKSEMPEGLQKHIKYPTTLFDIQADIYKEYHVSNPMVFYNEEDLWDIAKEKYMGEVQDVGPIYQIFKLPDADQLEFLLTVPYTPRDKPNMTSLLVARNDGEKYGDLVLYKLPKGETIQGPMMIESRIDQNTDISEQLTLWSQEGSKVLRGNVIIVPIENSLLYVEPIYLEADNKNSFPEVQRVVVSFKDKMVMERTLEEGLNKIFGEGEDQVEEEAEEDEEIESQEAQTDKETNQLIKKANQLFNKATEASQSGNWAEYGDYMEELEEVLKKLDK